MMQDESAEIQVETTVAKQNVILSTVSSLYSEEGPDDEFRPVKISIVTTTTKHEETRDEGEATPIVLETTTTSSSRNDDEIRMHNDDGDNDERVTTEEETNDRDTTRAEATSAAELRDDAPLEKDSEADAEAEAEAAVITITGSMQSKAGLSSLFDASFLDDESVESGGVEDEDDLSVVSKSVVDESKKNVEEAEALAKEMQTQLAGLLAEHSSSSTPGSSHPPSIEITTTATTTTPVVVVEPSATATATTENEHELPSSSSSSDGIRTFDNSPHPNIRTPASSTSSNDAAEGENCGELRIVNSTPESASASASSSSVVSSSSSAIDTPTARMNLRRQRPSFRRHRRPSTASWTSTEEMADHSTKPNNKVATFVSSLPLTHPQKLALETVGIPALLLSVAVAICRTFFHPWLKAGNNTTWALTWTVLCIVAVVAPVCALEYMLLSGLLAGTALQEAFAKYPEVKMFLKDVRQMRLKAGWWYPSEVRTLRRDLESTNAEILLQQQELSLATTRASASASASFQDGGEDDDDARSLQHQMSREEHHREKTQLERLFEGERFDWCNAKEELMAEASIEKEKNAQLRHRLELEEQKQHQLTAQKEQLENNTEVERALWNTSRASLEEALKTAVASQEDNEKTKEFFSKMEQARDEERTLWEKERDGFQASIHHGEEEARRVQHEHEGKVRLFDELRATKQSQWDTERKSLKDVVKTVTEDAKVVKDDLECQICQLMDAKDAKYERAIQDLKVRFTVQKMALEQLLEESKGEQHVSRRCVQNLQSVLEEERAEWNVAREALEESIITATAELGDAHHKLEHTETIFEEERNTWQIARTTFEDALVAANKNTNKNKSKNNGLVVTNAVKAAEQETPYIKTSLQQDLKLKESKIKALEESIQQLENIIMIQETIEKSNNDNTNTKNRRATANREAAAATLTPVAYVLPQGGIEVKLQHSSAASILSCNSRSIELSSSNISATGDEDHHTTVSTTSESSAYYSWVEKVQETHATEQRQLLRGLLSQHVMWQSANTHVGQLLASSRAMLEASDLFAAEDLSSGGDASESAAEVFHSCLVRYTAASMSAKRYMDELISKTGHGGPQVSPPFRVATAAAAATAAKIFDPPKVGDDDDNDDDDAFLAKATISELELELELELETANFNSDSVRSTRSIETVALILQSKNAPLWEQLWSSLWMTKTSPFRLCQTAVRSIFGIGIFGSISMFHRRASKHQQQQQTKMEDESR